MTKTAMPPLVSKPLTESERAWARRRAADLSAISPCSISDISRLLARDGAAWAFLVGTFLDWMRQATLISDTERQAALDAEPVPTGDPALDAELAGMAEQLAADYGLTVPAWVEDPSRFLQEGSQSWVFDTPEGREILRSKGLPAFSRHGVWVLPNHLSRM